MPVGDARPVRQRDSGGPIHADGAVRPHARATNSLDAVTIDNFSAASQATNYLLDLGHRRIGAITGPLHLSTGRGRLDGHAGRAERAGLTPEPRFVRSGRVPRGRRLFGGARAFLSSRIRPTALYVANGVMALGVMRAIADLGLRCPEDISIASTDNIPGIGGLRPSLTRTEHPIVDMVNESVRLLMDRIKGGPITQKRKVVFPSALVVGDSCAPPTAR